MGPRREAEILPEDVHLFTLQVLHLCVVEITQLYIFMQYLIHSCLFPVMNGHTSCVRLLLEDSDNADLVDTADSQGQ